MTKIQFEQYFATTFRYLTKNKMWFYDTGALFGPLYHACTQWQVSCVYNLACKKKMSLSMMMPSIICAHFW